MRCLVLASLVLGACGSSEPAAPAASSCDLTVDTLDGKAFVQLEVQGDKSEKPNPLARMKFTKQPDALHAAYTVANGLHVYDYTCQASGREGEVVCRTKPELKRACLALEVHTEGSCSAEALAKFGFAAEGTDAAKELEDAKKLAAEARKSEQWTTFKLMNNNVGNTLQGVLYVKVDTQRCRVQVDDMFLTIFEGQKKEDFNPVGTNAFVKAEQDYLYEDCTREGMLVDFEAPALPADLSTVPPVREHAAGAPVHYHYIGDQALKAEEGCTYAVSTWANWKPVETDKAVTVGEDGTIAWSVSHAWKADDRLFVGNDLQTRTPLRGGFFHLKRSKTCGGETKKIDVLCNAARITD
ncbi:MAG: hypothetical protein H6732_03645 [Alphaproteobacteria bacterium]|nr:hypothetical protein [Alphaproteobacteria bacterium]